MTSGVTLLVFLTISLALIAVYLVLRDMTAAAPAPQLRLREPLIPLGQSLPGNAGESFNLWFERLVREGNLAYSANLVALIILMAGFFPAAMFLVVTDDLLGAIVGFVVGSLLALIVFAIVRFRRVSRIQDQLPNVLDQLARTVRAGESLDQALVVVSESGRDPLGPELRRCVKQLEMGLSLPVALNGLYQRVPLVDMQIMVNTLSIYREVGGNLASQLERLATLMRERVAFRRQIRANTSAGRLAAFIIAIIVPIVFLYYYFFQAQSMDNVFKDNWGISLMLAALVLEIVGVLWVFAVVRIRN